MEIDPITAAKIATEFNDTLKEGLREASNTSRENTKSKEETKQKENQAKYETEQKIAKGHEETKIKMMEKVQSASEKAINIVQGIVKDIKNEYKETVGKKDKELATSKEEIKEYQKSLMSAYGEVQQYKAVEEARNIVANNIINYADKKAKYDEAIKNLKFYVTEKENDLKPLEMDLKTTETSIISLQDAYDDLGRRFEVVVKVMSELKFEHKGDMDPQKYSEKYDRKKRELKELIYDISNKEQQLLKKEKERLDKIDKINPLMIDLKRTKKVKDLLENNRENFLDTGILAIGNLQLQNGNIEKSNTENIIDVDVSESSESKKLSNEGSARV